MVEQHIVECAMRAVVEKTHTHTHAGARLFSRRVGCRVQLRITMFSLEVALC